MIAVILFTEQCLHFRLQRSETMTVPRMGSFFLKRTVFSQNLAKYKNEDVFMMLNFCYMSYYIKFRRMKICPAKSFLE